MENILSNLPTPLELVLDPTSYIVYGIYIVLIAWEAFFPARKLPKIKFWRLKGFIAFTLFFFLSSYLPLIWDTYLVEYQLFDLTLLGTAWGAVVGVLLYEFGVYVWHRSMHKSDRLWKVFHQMHHSAERIDSYGAFYFSPMDMIGFTFLGSLCLVVIAGFTAEATTWIILITTFLAIFQHSNIKTPVWIGYLIQRPEAHAIHHAKGIHAYNYSDISFFDIVFGTFKNPKGYDHEAGFYHGASEKVGEMLLFKDISKSES
ncbi:sterol desaturase family protein [Flagellimonas meridianipacifica]|uniref:Fatty acid hydroxylase family protein n=1 Tax=Flagellimonas meridianipacifica TaxID=1080225 RepID=A0A2T0MC87_9FLAO|nr:sterol desaturase family protein [Allomuricauda pacifica]PRX55108.1 fatty acid hydroxylase family protein [Allomuricauda pacifica]